MIYPVDSTIQLLNNRARRASHWELKWWIADQHSLHNRHYIFPFFRFHEVKSEQGASVMHDGGMHRKNYTTELHGTTLH